MADEFGLASDNEVIAVANELRREVEVVVPAEAPTPEHRASATSAMRSVAVLPFAVLGARSSEHDDRHWCDDLAEEMLSALIEIPGWRVVARSASFALGPTPGLAALRDELTTSHAVEGSIRRTATGLRVNLRVIDVADGRAVSWDRIDCDSAEPHFAQAAIARSLADRVRTL
jgi:TolB-like protein